MRILHLTSLLGLLLSVQAAQATILADGRSQDWEGVPVAVVDPLGDGGQGVDVDSLWFTVEHDVLILRFSTALEFLIQDGNALRLNIDCDNDPATGEYGADLRWRFGQRSGQFWQTSSYAAADQGELMLVTAPTVTGDDFEVALPLEASVNGSPVYTADTLRLWLDGTLATSDRVPDAGSVAIALPTEPQGHPAPLATERFSEHSLRYVTWNVLNDGFFDRPEPFRRMLQAMDPDLLMLVEMWNSDAEQVADSLDAWLPLEEASWQASKVWGDIILASRYPITGSWDILYARATAYRVELPAPWNGPLFTIGAHPPCCDNETGRQEEMDAIMAAIRQAREGVQGDTLFEGTPIVISGDMNLVGYRRQLETLLTGDILDNASFGPDFNPDWDGSALKDNFPRQVARNMVYTWRNDGSSYSPGKLDYIVTSDAVVEVLRSFVLDTERLPDTTRWALGVHADDSDLASDHQPVVADLLPVGWQSAPDAAAEHALPGRLEVELAPNPFNSSLHVSVAGAAGRALTVEIFDVMGRRVQRWQLSPGASTRLLWDGRSEAGLPAASGLYFVRAQSAERLGVAKAMLLR